jgi:HEAT repeat protein
MDAAKRLGEKKGKVGIDELIASLNDKNQYVRGWAAWALGEIGTQRAVDPLIAALAKYKEIAKTDHFNDESKCLTDFVKALQELTGEDFGLDTHSWQEWASKNKDAHQ